MARKQNKVKIAERCHQVLVHWAAGTPDHEIRQALGLTEAQWRTALRYIEKQGGHLTSRVGFFHRLLLRQETIRRHAMRCFERFSESTDSAAIAVGFLRTALESDRAVVEFAEKLGVIDQSIEKDRDRGFTFVDAKGKRWG